MPDPTPLTPYSILPKKKKWIIPGQDFKRDNTIRNDGSEVDVNLDIPETEGIVMPGKKEIFGLPVHARLAVFYIRKLWTEIERKRLLSIHQDTKSLFDVVRKNLGKKTEDFKREEFLKELDEIDNRWEEANNWLIELLRNSFAATMDKSILLKTMSQPECEGIRFYLAMKRTRDDNAKDQPPLLDAQRKPVKLTLVTVGVDKQGFDLHYHFDPDKHKINEIPDIENESLCTEYPRTPGIAEKYKINLPALEPYVLFRYAMVKDEV